ncbi:MAG: deoxynucleoside kinase [Deltaproteobacteria bacterium]|nr:deoxynucleoside kinase [Deltaproteobacteria bacterium]
MARRLVVVEGVIGVGKTTLVQRLAQRLNGRLVFEEFEENPFLPDFYRDREAFAFSTQIFFLMSRFRQQEVLAQGDLFHQVTLSDYLFDKDRVFALLTLERHELALYERLFDVLRVQVPKPDLVIYLRADLEVVLARIAARDRPYERGMDPEYIRALSEAYGRFFSSYDECPVVVLDTTDRDLRTDDATIDRLAAVVLRGRGGGTLDQESSTLDLFPADRGRLAV